MKYRLWIMWTILFCVFSGAVVLATIPADYVAPVTVTVPHYAAHYAPREQVQSTGDLSEVLTRLRRIEDKIDEHGKAIADLVKLAKEELQPGTTTPPPVAPSVPAVSPVVLLRAANEKCAKCHHENVYEAKGGGFQIFKGTSYAALTARDYRKIVTMVEAGEMPPPDSKVVLTDDERKALLGYFTPRAAAIKAPATKDG